MYVTQHAVERFRRRFAGGLSHAHALRELVVITRTARRLDGNTADGAERWAAEDGSGMVLVVRSTPPGKRPKGDGRTVVTVLFGTEEDDPVCASFPTVTARALKNSRTRR